MKRGCVLVMMMVSVLAATGPVQAEDSTTRNRPPIEVGNRIRVIEGGRFDHPVTGSVVAVDDQGVEVKRDGAREPRRLTWRAINSLGISRGRHSHPKSGAMTGALLIGIPMALVGACSRGGCFDPDYEPRAGQCKTAWCRDSAVAGFMVGAIVGGLAGAAIGSVKTERWEKVDLRKPKLTIGVSPQRWGVSASLAVRF